jgi:hypothetical protein
MASMTSISLSFHTAHNMVVALPPDPHGKDDNGCDSGTEDLVEHARYGHYEELRHRQGALSGMQVEHGRQVWECSHVWVVQEEGED